MRRFQACCLQGLSPRYRSLRSKPHLYYSVVIELSRLVFEVLRKDEEFVLYRGRSKNDSFQVLVLSPVAEYPSPESLKRLDHEYSLRENLDARWTALPRAIARHWGRTVLVLEDPGGVPLVQLLGRPLNLAFSLRLAIKPVGKDALLRVIHMALETVK